MGLSGMAVLLLTGVGASDLSQRQTPPLPAQTTCAPHGSEVHVSAIGLRFNTNCLAAPANHPFTIVFANRDGGVPHDVSIAPLSSLTRSTTLLFHGPLITGPRTIAYRVGALRPGTYLFFCVVHPWQMRGTFVVR